jgi:hypothetical protein
MEVLEIRGSPMKRRQVGVETTLPDWSSGVGNEYVDKFDVVSNRLKLAPMLKTSSKPIPALRLCVYEVDSSMVLITIAPAATLGKMTWAPSTSRDYCS